MQIHPYNNLVTTIKHRFYLLYIIIIIVALIHFVCQCVLIIINYHMQSMRVSSIENNIFYKLLSAISDCPSNFRGEHGAP